MPVEIRPFASNITYTEADRHRYTVDLLWEHQTGCFLLQCLFPHRDEDAGSWHTLRVPAKCVPALAECLTRLVSDAPKVSPDVQPMGYSDDDRWSWIYADEHTPQRFAFPVVIVSDQHPDAKEQVMAFLPVEVLAPLAADLTQIATATGMQRKRLRQVAFTRRRQADAEARQRARLTEQRKRGDSLATALRKPRSHLAC